MTMLAAVFLVTGAVNLQLPLYGAMAQAGGFGASQMSLLLQGYVAALILTLTTAGGVADRFGSRRPVLISLGCALIATLGVMLSPGLAMLGVARWFQGAGVALVMGSATAALAERWGPPSAARWVGAASTLGFGAGALATTASLASTPGALTAELLWSGGLIAVGAALFRMTGPSGDPQISVLRLPSMPPGTRVANTSLLAAWAVSGVVVAVLPGVLHGSGHGAWAGVMLFLMLAGGLVGQIPARRMSSRRSLQLGLIILALGTAAMSFGVASDRIGLIAGGALLLGMATHGWIYVGALVRAGECAPRSAAAVSGTLLAAYIGFGGPAIAVGLAVDRLGSATAFTGFAASVAIVSALLLALERPSARAQAQGLEKGPVMTGDHQAPAPQPQRLGEG